MRCRVSPPKRPWRPNLRSIPGRTEVDPLHAALLQLDWQSFGAVHVNAADSRMSKNCMLQAGVTQIDVRHNGVFKSAALQLFILEDDPGEYQEKLRKVIGTRDTAGRIKIVTRDDFYDANVSLDVRDQRFRESVEYWANYHHPDLIVLDNLAQVVGAQYNEPQLVHVLMQFCYRLARSYNAAIILPAHPKKEDPNNRVSLIEDPDAFFESIMGSSHFVNSTGSLWGLERQQEGEHSVFLGGRQRGDGNQGGSFIGMDEHGWYTLIDESQKNIGLVLNTEIRRKAWSLLPGPPEAFGYRDGEALVKSVMKSSSTYADWISHCRRLKVIVDGPGGKLAKAAGLKP